MEVFGETESFVPTLRVLGFEILFHFMTFAAETLWRLAIE